MQFIIGIVIIFMPVIFLIFLARNVTNLMEVEKTIELPSSISLLNPVYKNYAILKQNLLENHKFSEKDALKVCNIFKSMQLSVLSYIGGGILQVFGIVFYIIWAYIKTDFFILYRENPNQLGSDITIITMVCISFWIFYGNQLFDYIGLYKAKKAINFAISALFKAQESLQKKVIVFASSCLYFAILLVYLYFLIPIAKCMGDAGSGFTLVGICVLIFIFYYGVPKLFSVIYSKMFVKLDRKIDKQIIYKILKNNTYLHLLIIYFYGILVGQVDNFLLYGINILFLYDSYHQNKKEIVSFKK